MLIWIQNVVCDETVDVGISIKSELEHCKMKNSKGFFWDILVCLISVATEQRCLWELSEAKSSEIYCNKCSERIGADQWPDEAIWLVDGISTVKWTTPRGEGESAFAGEATVPSSPSLLIFLQFQKDCTTPSDPFFYVGLPRKKNTFSQRWNLSIPSVPAGV